jgi:hypothetical protein
VGKGRVLFPLISRIKFLIISKCKVPSSRFYHKLIFIKSPCKNVLGHGISFVKQGHSECKERLSRLVTIGLHTIEKTGEPETS